MILKIKQLDKIDTGRNKIQMKITEIVIEAPFVDYGYLKNYWNIIEPRQTFLHKRM